jgi:hypothetical protein
MKRFARNKVELAKALSISRRGLQRFFEFPDHPESKSDGRLDCRAWAKFISVNASRIETGTMTIPLSRKDDTRIKLLELQIQHEAVKLEKARNALITEGKIYFRGRLEQLWARLERLIRWELPPILESRTARQISTIAHEKLREAWNSFCAEVGAELKERGA